MCVVSSRMRRSPLVAALITAFSVVPAAARADVAECSFGAGTATVTVAIQGGSAILRRSGDAVTVDGVDCGGTVTGTDAITVTGTSGDHLTISLGGGPFAPGATDEGDGSSEIEITVGGSVSLVIRGSSGPDMILAGSVPSDFPVDAVFDLNGDEATPDADVAMPLTALDPTGGLTDELRGGDDTFSGGGFVGALPIPFLGKVALLRAGGGDDTVQPAGSTGIYIGDKGIDAFSFRWLPSECFGEYVAGSGLLSCGSTGDVSFTGGPFERLLGHAGTDWLGGGARAGVIRGFGGGDQLWVSPGDGVIDGGPGRDLAIFDELAAKIHADLRAGTADGGGHRTLDGIESLYGSKQDDVLIGNGRPNEIQGSAGNDTLYGKGGVDALYGGPGTNGCDAGLPGLGEAVVDCGPISP